MEAAAPRAETAIAVPIAPGAPGPLAAHIVPTTAEETVPPKPRKNIANLPRFRLHPYAAILTAPSIFLASDSAGLRLPRAEWILTLL